MDITPEMRDRSNEIKNKIIEKIISVVSPILLGLTHCQISEVLDKATKKLTEEIIFTGSLYHGKYDSPVSEGAPDLKKNETI